MKKNSFLFVMASFMLVLTACSTKSDLVVPPVDKGKVPAKLVAGKYLQGPIKKTMKQNSTYYLLGSIAVYAGDTLTVQPGATIIVNGNYQIQISGTFLSLGTEAKQVTFTSDRKS